MTARRTPSPRSSPVALLVAAGLAATLPACGPAPGGGDAPDASPRVAETAGEDPSERDSRAARDEPGTAAALDLPEPYRELIRSEMKEVESAMGRLLGHLVRAEAREGAEVAHAVHDSFVLAQRMTAEQRRELRSLLPPTFVALDREFHHRAELLAEALEGGDFFAAAAHHAELSRACVTCHSRFATDRFPAFAAAGAGGEEGSEGEP